MTPEQWFCVMVAASIPTAVVLSGAFDLALGVWADLRSRRR